MAFFPSSTLVAGMQPWIHARVELFTRPFLLVFSSLPCPLPQKVKGGNPITQEQMSYQMCS